MKIGGLSFHPAQEGGDIVIRQKLVSVHADARQLCVGELNVQLLVTDRVEQNDLTPAPAFWHRVVPFDRLAQRALTQPAWLGRRR